MGTKFQVSRTYKDGETVMNVFDFILKLFNISDQDNPTAYVYELDVKLL